MANEASPSETGVVLNDNDVLCGRGLGASKFIGNKRFRDLVDARRDEYVSEDSYNEKAVIAQEIYMFIRSQGGRFLKMVGSDTKKPARSVVETGIWVETDVKSALEKCKQALREKQAPTDGGGAKARNSKKKAYGSPRETKSAEGATEARTAESNAAVCFSSLGWNGNISQKEHSPMSTETPAQIQSSTVSGTPFSSFIPPTTTFLGSSIHTTVDSRILLFNSNLFSALQQSLMRQQQQQQVAMHPVYPLQDHHSLQAQGGMTSGLDAANAFIPSDAIPQAIRQGLYERDLASRILQLQAQGTLLRQPDAATLEPMQPPTSPIWRDDQDFFEPPSVSNNKEAPTWESDREEAAFALSALAVSDRPRFTQQQEAIERATLTDEERLAALSDLFGQMCLVSNHQAKRARKDLDRESISFLVKHMRIEIERIPANKKQALLEAQTKCRAEEFSDARLERFLRCEGMNTKVRTMTYVS